MKMTDCRFITAAEKSERAVYFRKEFSVRGKIASAKLYLSAIGVVKGYANGEEVDNDYLTPGWTDYRKRAPYYVFDITNKLTAGENVLGFILGNGWACGKIGWFGKYHYAEKPYLWYFVEIVYADASMQSFGSDKGTMYAFGAIMENDLQDGEEVDENNEVNFCRVGNSTVVSIPQEHPDWHKKLEKASVPLTKAMEILQGEYIGEDKGELLYDFGQNHAGVPKIYLSNAKKGDKLTVRYGEMLDVTGELYTDNLRSARCTDVFVCKENSDIFAPIFTFHGYRYLSIRIEGSVKVEKTESLALYSALDVCGEFACSNENVNQLYSNLFWGQKSNFLNVPTDCPQRDERLGWSGDCQTFCATAMYNMDCREFFRKHLTDVRDAQLPDGMVEVFAPCVQSNCDKFDGVAAWADEITVLPYHYYLFYKDKRVVEENLPAAKKWVEYCVNNSENYIRPNKGYSDWLSVDDDMDQRVLGTLFFAYSALLTAKMCKIVGDSEADRYFALYGDISAAFKATFVDDKGVIFSDTQTCYLLAYAFGVLSAEEIRPHLIETLRRKDYHLSTGFIGVRYLLPVLCQLGEYALAYRLLVRTDYPSWCYSVVNGATTIWERWNSFTKGIGFADRRMNSFNHYSLGSVGEWLYAYALGIRFDEKGVKIAPIVDPTGSITWAKGSYALEGKKISVRWQNEGNGYFSIEIRASKEVEIDLSQYKEARGTDGIYTVKL